MDVGRLEGLKPWAGEVISIVATLFRLTFV